jgi:DNA-binding NtrC family response regulator
LAQNRLRSEHRLLARHVRRDYLFGEMVGASPAMQRTFELIERAAASDVPVLILGETGTGKELVARALHRGGGHASGPFVPVDCGAIPEGLMESELFGHEAGAFTGANERSMGLMQLADGGVFFLDEIAELPVALQAKLLRVLQEKKVRRVGGNREVSVNARVVAATNRDLEQLVREGAFREDLYYRLNVVGIEVPALRQRRDDIPLLVSHFLAKIAAGTGRESPSIDQEVLEVLCAYPWPGNVRELQNVVRRLAALTRGPEVGIDDLPESLVLEARSAGPVATGFFQQRGEVLERFEREYLEGVLRSCGGRVMQAAKIAGVPRGTLYRLLKRCDIDAGAFRRG